ncbi:MAG: hypothetical protein JW909_05530 [Planctomycetes bacterium]|nr:hypothetical protein [Planctomycetota bacterium]
MQKSAGCSLWIAVPTYWTHPASAPGGETTVFDHPTPLDEEGTLARTLESFTNLRGDFSVLVVAATAHPALGEEVHSRVSRLLQPFAGRIRLFLASPVSLDALNGALGEPLLSLDSYGSIRNVQLAVPYALGADAVLGIDDDEVIDNPDFLDLVERRVSAGVAGMAGPYFDRRGDWRIEGAEELASEPNIFVRKNFFMNRAIGRAMDSAGPDGLAVSNVAFGGNMVMSRSTIARVCHDPYIPRGEDYDYVINAAMDGILWRFCPAMSIVHLPPDSTGSQAGDRTSKLIADIRRFIYMREKMRLHAELFPRELVDPDYLMPYPGPYLAAGVDLPAEGVRALDGKYPEFRASGGSPEQVVSSALDTARVKAAEFFEYRRRWRSAFRSTASAPRMRLAAQALAMA